MPKFELIAWIYFQEWLNASKIYFIIIYLMARSSYYDIKSSYQQHEKQTVLSWNMGRWQPLEQEKGPPH